MHELLSAYDWIPHDEFEGVLFGWGDYQYEDDKDVWMRFSGHLDYSAFAVQYGLVDGELSLHAYSRQAA